ncbi:GDP-mannose 4,6-dehydratase [Anaerocolumna sp. AGMB13025]|uniref:GDP-mannose 4,6-dehydratase n=1 Tax=Anaerocolumna sp. AGMB13025 TaxID=3039116 RepID=UPI00241E37B0|nr:GDP-mannose 4,6-dehydratase [Anaerocolumna sp. AGMB13025]WFR56308.1 GDP-mannose 4,6-dehydratase [Anaerocolumna sp. AGMB13025]
MKALIIGGAGFVGYYLTDHLLNDCGWSVAVTKLENEIIEQDNISIYDLDILDKKAIFAILNEVHPDYIFHLAAQSSVSLSWKNPALTIDVNIKGCVNVLDAVKELDYKPRILLIGSGEEYGYVLPDEIPINENNHVRPGNIYAATKACQNMIGKIYSDAYQMDIIMVRAFNHIGPRQSPMFVVADFCKQVAEIEKGLREPVIRVGNLDVKRDFTDVRDVVRAYSLLIQKGHASETYNVGCGNAISIKEILQRILTHTKVNIKVDVDRYKLRPVDIPLIEADIRKLHDCTAWNGIINLDRTILDTLEYWRSLLL